MLTFNGNLKVYVALQPCDMRKSFNGLWAEVTNQLKLDPQSGAIFAFTNKRKNRIKILYWDGTGVWVLAKRLEQGNFKWPTSAKTETNRISLTPEALAMLTDGIELRNAGRLAWYERD